MMSVGRMLMFAGLLLAVIGGVVMLFEKSGIPLGRLPGDIAWKGKNTTFYFPNKTREQKNTHQSFVLWLVNRR